MMRDLDALASQARGYLVDKGCARSTIAHHGAAWKRLMSWCEDEGIGGHGHDAGRRLMEGVAVANAAGASALASADTATTTPNLPGGNASIT